MKKEKAQEKTIPREVRGAQALTCPGSLRLQCTQCLELFSLTRSIQSEQNESNMFSRLPHANTQSRSIFAIWLLGFYCLKNWDEESYLSLEQTTAEFLSSHFFFYFQVSCFTGQLTQGISTFIRVNRRVYLSFKHLKMTTYTSAFRLEPRWWELRPWYHYGAEHMNPSN